MHESTLGFFLCHVDDSTEDAHRIPRALYRGMHSSETQMCLEKNSLTAIIGSIYAILNAPLVE